MVELTFFVPGKVQPGGSKRSFPNPKTGRAIIVDDNPKSYGWKSDVKTAASRAFIEAGWLKLIDGPIFVDALFVRERPRSHYGTGKNSSVIKPAFLNALPTTKPDATKLWRSTEDACTGVIWTDDARIVDQRQRKEYGDVPGAHITVRTIDV